MTTRSHIGEKGWYEYNQQMQNAIVARAGDEGETIPEAFAAFVLGEADPGEYGLTDEGDGGDGSGGDD